jgi:anti-sigma factor RsiW
MNNIEETLWNYIDGTCTPEERQAAEAMIASDKRYSQKYDELLALHHEFEAIELDEPPMAFTYNVMETIRTETARTPLKAAIDNRVIRGIAAFFILTILVLTIMALTSVDWTAANNAVSPITDVQVPEISHYFNSAVLKGFLFFDLVLGLFLFDAYLRRHSRSKAA